ncbi:MAG: FAD-dependent oxidoreductase [Candidatus Margulisiibacteriota bacterium]
MQYDIVVIGSGPGGNNAAWTAAKLGKKVLIIEKDEVGGVCLNRGCMPTKALIASAEVYLKAKRADEFGIKAENVSFEWKKIIERKNSIVQKLRKSLDYMFKTAGIDVVKGVGTIIEPGIVSIAGANHDLPITVKSPAIIISTGSDNKRLPGFETAITSDEALNLEELPKSITIIGSGAIGMEFACIFNTFGVEVTVIEVMPQILPGIDEEISKSLEQILKRKGIKILTNTKFDTDAVQHNFVAIGRSFNKIDVNERLQTKDKGIYAVGDVTGISMYAHSAAMQGIVAARNICGIESKMDYSAVPSCVFSIPEVASAGLTENQAKEKGIKVKVAKENLAAIGKYTVLGEREGFIKMVAEKKSGKIVGCQIIGHGATDLIAEAGAAIRNNLTAEDLAKTIHAHPTLPEAIWEAAKGVI